MTAAIWPAGAPTNKYIMIKCIFVKRLQMRISKAIKEIMYGNHCKLLKDIIK